MLRPPVEDQHGLIEDPLVPVIGERGHLREGVGAHATDHHVATAAVGAGAGEAFGLLGARGFNPERVVGFTGLRTVALRAVRGAGRACWQPRRFRGTGAWADEGQGWCNALAH